MSQNPTTNDQFSYEARPVKVQAYVITEVKAPAAPDGPFFVTLEDGRDHLCFQPMAARYMPVPGDYLVIQEDNYEYFNPKEVFERKYKQTRRYVDRGAYNKLCLMLLDVIENDKGAGEFFGVKVTMHPVDAYGLPKGNTIPFHFTQYAIAHDQPHEGESR